MSRTDKLYDRFQQLEREFLSRVRAEFAAESCGTRSAFLQRHISPLVDSAHIDQLDRLVTQIESLRCKLGESIPGPALNVLNHFRRTWEDLGARQRSNIWKSLVKQALNEIDAQQVGGRPTI